MLGHFALGDDAAFVGVHKLDRLLDRDDVPRVVSVDVIDESGQCRRLARAGRARDQDESAAQVAKLPNDCRNAKLGE
jgi:hypothetical protein